jgi:hypothetical protein
MKVRASDAQQEEQPQHVKLLLGGTFFVILSN